MTTTITTIITSAAKRGEGFFGVSTSASCVHMLDATTNNHSGQVVKGAPPPGATPQGRIEELFDNARRRGATDGVADDLRGVPGYHGTSQGGFAAFGGRARTLADASGDTPAAAPTPTPVAAPAAQGPLAHVIVFYRNGVFTVDDGMLLYAPHMRALAIKTAIAHPPRPRSSY